MIINPIRSAKVRTLDSFSFKYGKVEISAKMPTGDWLIPGTHFQRYFFLFQNHSVCCRILVNFTWFVVLFFKIIAISFLPKDNAYGAWPSSGEIDLVLSRGNRNYTHAEKHIGVEQFVSSLHFGPFASLDQYQTTLFVRNSKPGNGFNNDFHRYQMEWTPGKHKV